MTDVRSGLCRAAMAGVAMLALLAACAGAGRTFKELPVLPAISPKMKAVYQAGIAQGNNPRVFSKLGDCMTDNEHFLRPLAEQHFDLGSYGSLSDTIAQFSGVPARAGQGWMRDSFASPSLAAAGGFNVAGPLDATWADPAWCQPNESPLACEYRVAKPSVAILMFGTNDVAATEPKAFEQYLRTLVQETLQRNIVPVLNTFPTRPENPARADELNQIVARVAADTDVPLINLNRALDGLPGNGVDPKDSTHLSLPQNGRADIFTAEGLQAGANVRNLVTLQALQLLLAAVK